MNDVMSVERVSAPMQVMRAIRDAIRRGELKEGDKLPPENELAKQLKVGRSSFREGMRLLSAYGVVEIRQGEGTFIINKACDPAVESYSELLHGDNRYLHTERINTLSFVTAQ